MGDVIRKDAAADDIIADARATLDNARSKKGIWQTLAEEKLAPSLAVVEVVVKSLEQATRDAAPLVSAVHAVDDRGDSLIGKQADEAWNLLGRPASDPYYDLLYPGGIAAYTEGSDEEQPLRMLQLATLLEAGIHPRLDTAFTKNAAIELRGMAAEYQAALDAARPLKVQSQLLSRTKTTLARGLQLGLSNLKKRYKSEGFSEAEIHTVIPDRPRTKAP